MSTEDLKTALAALKPTTMAVQVRPLLPMIADLRNNGVGFPEIIKVLHEHGLEITEPTLKTYLARWRKKHACSSTVTTMAPNKSGSPTPMDIATLLHPDPEASAEEFARLERQGREMARASKKRRDE